MAFYLKKCVCSGQDVPEQIVSIKLQDTVEEEKVLGLYWDVKKDKFYLKFARKDAYLQFLVNIKIEQEGGKVSSSTLGKCLGGYPGYLLPH